MDPRTLIGLGIAVAVFVIYVGGILTYGELFWPPSFICEQLSSCS